MWSLSSRLLCVDTSNTNRNSACRQFQAAILPNSALMCQALLDLYVARETYKCLAHLDSYIVRVEITSAWHIGRAEPCRRVERWYIDGRRSSLILRHGRSYKDLMSRKRTLFLIGLALMAAFVLASCRKQEEPTPTTAAGISVPTAETTDQPTPTTAQPTPTIEPEPAEEPSSTIGRRSLFTAAWRRAKK